LRAPPDAWLDLASHPGAATLTATEHRLSGSATPAFLARRQQHQAFSATAALRLGFAARMSAGLAVFQNEARHFYLGVQRDGPGWLVFLERTAGGTTEVLARQTIDGAARQVELRIEAAGRPYSFAYRAGDGEWRTLLGDVDGSILRSVVPESFVGSYVGLHARRE